jgi:signal transduction histidine kinase
MDMLSTKASSITNRLSFSRPRADELHVTPAAAATGTVDFVELAPTFHTVRAFTVASTAACIAVLGAAWDPRLVWTLLILAFVALGDAFYRRSRPEGSPKPRLLVEASVITLTVLLIGGPALVAAPVAYLLTAALLILPLRRALLVVAFLTACVVAVFFSAMPAADNDTQWWMGLGAMLVFLAALCVLLIAAFRVNRNLREREALLLEEARAANQAKTELLATVSHELRTPLASVMGFAQLLRDETAQLTDEDRTEAIRSIAEQSFDLSALIDDLLIAARHQIGELSVTAVRTNPRAQVAQVLENWDHRVARTIDLTGEARPVLADPTRVRQIVRNLLSNAVRYGGPLVRILLASSDTTSSIEVRDNGTGIPAETTEAIFDPFVRVPTDQPNPASVGLGLAVSRDLARLMDGDLTYRRDGGETVFELELPLADAA